MVIIHSRLLKNLLIYSLYSYLIYFKKFLLTGDTSNVVLYIASFFLETKTQVFKMKKKKIVNSEWGFEIKNCWPTKTYPERATVSQTMQTTGVNCAEHEWI